KTLNKSAAKVFTKLIEGLAVGEGRKIDNTDGAFMPVSVNRLTDRQYSVTHYFEQNGDFDPDPDMTFLVYPHAPDQIVPLTIQHSTGHYTEAYELDANDDPKTWKPAVARDITSFANTWMKNIKMQQSL